VGLSRHARDKSPGRSKLTQAVRNPPNEAHWTKRVFVDKTDPDTRMPFRDKDNYKSLVMNPGDNAQNLPPEYLKELENLPERMRRRFLQGLFGTLAEGALWTLESLDIGRVLDGNVPDMQRVVIGVDPSGCSGPDDVRSDEVGIIVVGLGVDGRAYVLEDLSGWFGPGGPQGWGKIVGSAFDRHGADRVVAETNFGGDMVHEVIRVARPGTPFKKVTASRGKVVRAEPISALYGSENSVGKISHVGHFPKLEDQLCGFTTAGYVGDKVARSRGCPLLGLSRAIPNPGEAPEEGYSARAGSTSLSFAIRLDGLAADVPPSIGAMKTSTKPGPQ
jgi:hypothetical protein